FIACNSARHRIIRLSPSCHSLITLLKPQKDLFSCSIFAHQLNVLDTKSTECDASTFLVMPALV
ncbi:hypothetical protein, partial [Aeromonas veronii]|uniref:hypothetical protein n=2 Tax=Aeromonas veronii TaxID=654 RepID=UPI00195CD289